MAADATGAGTVHDISLVIMTRDRGDELMRTLGRLAAGAPDVPAVVVDNGSCDATSERVRERFPHVEVMTFDVNIGVAARNAAVQAVDTPYVAFNDDDSWWEGESLTRAVELFDRHPRLGALTAHVVVEPGGRDDPTSLAMAASPLDGDPSLPGAPVLGFLACALAVRRSAFLAVGGFEQRFHFGGEEQLLATDLAAAGWAVRYVSDLRVHHHPSTVRDRGWRRRRQVRNTLWYLWLRRPAGVAARRSWQVLHDADTAAAVGGVADALRGAGWVARERRVVPARVERALALLDAQRIRDRRGVR